MFPLQCLKQAWLIWHLFAWRDLSPSGSPTVSDAKHRTGTLSPLSPFPGDLLQKRGKIIGTILVGLEHL